MKSFRYISTIILVFLPVVVVAQRTLSSYSSVSAIENTDRYLICQQGDTLSFIYDKESKKSYPTMIDGRNVMVLDEVSFLGERKGEPVFCFFNRILFGLHGFSAKIWDLVRDFTISAKNNMICLQNNYSNDIWISLDTIPDKHIVSVFNEERFSGEYLTVSPQNDDKHIFLPVIFSIDMPILNYSKAIRKHILYWIADCYAQWKGEDCCFNILDETTTDELCENIKRIFVNDNLKDTTSLFGINRPREEKISIERILNTKDYASFVMHIDYCGGGSGTASKTFAATFDLKKNRRLTMSDFVKTDYIQKVYNSLPEITLDEVMERLVCIGDNLEEIPVLGWNGILFLRTVYTIHGGIDFTDVIPYDSISSFLKIHPRIEKNDNSYNTHIQFKLEKELEEEGIEESKTYWSHELVKSNSINWVVDEGNAMKNDKVINGSYNRNYAKSIRDLEPLKAISIYKKLIEENPSQIFKNNLLASFLSLAWQNIKKGEEKRGKEICMNVIDTLKQMGEDDEWSKIWEFETEERYSIYVDAEIILADIFYRQKKKEEALEKAKLIVGLLIPQLQKQLPQLTRDKRSTLWQHYRSWLTENLLHIAKWTQDESLCQNAYNAQLYGKGLLLNTEIAMHRYIQEHGGEEEKQLLKEYLDKMKEAEKYRNSGNNKDLKDTETEMKRLESEMMAYQGFSDNMNLQNVTIGQVARNLREGEVAIEFADVKEDNDTIYYALTLQAGDTVPDIVKLCSASQLCNMSTGEAINGGLYKQIWQPLQPQLQGKHTIFFSPSGKLHMQPLEWTCVGGSSKSMSETYSMYRLSSTREIAHARDSIFKNEHGQGGTGLLMGGLDFDASIDDATSDVNTENRQDVSLIRGGVKLKKVKKLPATLLEVEDIKPHVSQLSDIDKVEVLIGNNGTEAVFKRKAEEQVSLLHIATHGFYLADDDFTQLEKNNYFSKIGKQYRDIEEKGLVRSGLVFAGINQVLQKKVIPSDSNDGVMTAMEISHMNLNDVDLAVLSACQTGQGEIGDDGVMGLQRGFKKAGVNSLLMTLWKVDDEATHLFMTKFYEQLAKGSSKQESLVDAQRYLREETSYKDSHFWAAFILLDGLK